MGVVQPASGTYISECATEEKKGFYFAFFWSFYMGSQVIGNLIAAFMLGSFPQIAYVLLMLGICTVSVGLLYFLRDPQIHHNTTQHTISQMNDAPQHKATLKDGCLKLWHLSLDRRFLWLLPQTWWTGVSIAYFSGNLVEMLQWSIGGNDD